MKNVKSLSILVTILFCLGLVSPAFAKSSNAYRNADPASQAVFRAIDKQKNKQIKAKKTKNKVVKANSNRKKTTKKKQSSMVSKWGYDFSNSKKHKNKSNNAGGGASKISRFKFSK